MQTAESPIWVQVFRFLACMFGLIGIGALVVHWRTPLDMAYSYWIGGLTTMGLLFFAFAPRAIWSRFWKAGALLGCTGLIFTTVQSALSFARGTDPVYASGSIPIIATFLVMLIDAVRSRPALGQRNIQSEQKESV